MNKSDWRDLTLLMAGLVALAGCWIAGMLLTPDTPPESAPAAIPESAGRDFPIYWGAWRVLNAGENLQEDTSFQKWISSPLEESFALHNPPWVLVLFSFPGALPYAVALQAWLFAQLLLSLGAGFLTCRLLGRRPDPWVMGSGFLFLPLITCIYFGQITLALTVVSLSLLLCLKEKRDFLGGGCLALMTLKPHLFFLFVLVIGLEILRDRRWKLVAGFALSMAVMVSVLQASQPEAIGNWWRWLQSGGAGDWTTATIPSWVRLGVFYATGNLEQWPSVVIPGLAVLAVGILWTGGFFKDRSWLDRYMLLTGGSLFLAPYAWSYDLCLLLPWQLVLVSQIREQGSGDRSAYFTSWGLLIVFSLAWIGQLVAGFKDMHTFVWAPIFLTITWLARIRPLPGSSGANVRNY